MSRLEVVKEGDADWRDPKVREAEASTPADKAGPGPTPYKSLKQYRSVPIGQPQELREALLGMIPVCVQSQYCNLHLKQTRHGECSYDQGGYLIVRGFERVVQPQKNLLPGRPIVTAEKNRVQRSILFEAEIRSPHPSRARNTSTMYMYITREPSWLYVKIPFLGGSGKKMTPIPITVLFKLFGFDTVEDIRTLVFPMYDPSESGSSCTTEDCIGVTKDEASASAMQKARALFETQFMHPRFQESFPALYEWLASESSFKTEKRRRDVHNQIKAECLPQFGSEFDLPTRTKKGLFLGSVARRLLLMRVDPAQFPPDYKDDDGNKYLQLMHSVLSIMYRQLYNEMMSQLTHRLYYKL